MGFVGSPECIHFLGTTMNQAKPTSPGAFGHDSILIDVCAQELHRALGKTSPWPVESGPKSAISDQATQTAKLLAWWASSAASPYHQPIAADVTLPPPGRVPFLRLNPIAATQVESEKISGLPLNSLLLLFTLIVATPILLVWLFPPHPKNLNPPPRALGRREGVSTLE